MLRYRLYPAGSYLGISVFGDSATIEGLQFCVYHKCPYVGSFLVCACGLETLDKILDNNDNVFWERKPATVEEAGIPIVHTPAVRTFINILWPAEITSKRARGV